MISVNVIVASTTGHSDYVAETAIARWKQASSGISVSKQRAEQASGEDLLKADVIVLASGSWNTEGIEGQMNPHMHHFLKNRAANIDLRSKKIGIIALGDDRYFFTLGARKHMEDYVRSHGGILVEPVLGIVNEPYGQEKIVEQWADTFLSALQS